ncbi:MAG: hypothetical protein ACW99G_18220 [Candidatus Thorarchaeota archaeon]|jgi:hypothetical protein
MTKESKGITNKGVNRKKRPSATICLYGTLTLLVVGLAVGMHYDIMQRREKEITSQN